MSDWATLHVALHIINNFKPINKATEQFSVIFRVSWYTAKTKHEVYPFKANQSIGEYMKSYWWGSMATI